MLISHGTAVKMNMDFLYPTPRVPRIFHLSFAGRRLSYHPATSAPWTPQLLTIGLLRPYCSDFSDFAEMSVTVLDLSFCLCDNRLLFHMIIPTYLAWTSGEGWTTNDRLSTAYESYPVPYYRVWSHLTAPIIGRIRKAATAMQHILSLSNPQPLLVSFFQFNRMTSRNAGLKHKRPI